MTNRKEKITAKSIETALRNMDWEKFNARYLWRLNTPRCDCKNCSQYESWLEWGKEVYKDNIDVYKEKVRQEEILRVKHRRLYKTG